MWLTGIRGDIFHPGEKTTQCRWVIGALSVSGPPVLPSKSVVPAGSNEILESMSRYKNSTTVSYYHLFQISVSQGQAVLSGDVVGITGNTGRCTEEHLHITCKYKGSIINPILIVDYIAHITMIPWI